MRPLVVKLTAGADEPERVSQAFTVAATALASGSPTSLWLTGEASRLACPGEAETFRLEHAPPLADLRDALIADGQVTVCSQCALRRGLTQDDFVPGIRLAGAALFVEECLTGDSQALVY